MKRNTGVSLAEKKTKYNEINLETYWRRFFSSSVGLHSLMTVAVLDLIGRSSFHQEGIDQSYAMGDWLDYADKSKGNINSDAENYKGKFW